MPIPKTITIDASSAASGVNLDTYIADYFAGLQQGSSSYYGGTATSGYGYYSGSQVGFRYKDGAGVDTNKQIVIDNGAPGDPNVQLAYDGIYGPAYGHGISGRIDTVIFGSRVGAQEPTDNQRLADVTADLIISGWDLNADKGAGTTPENRVYTLYNALRKAGTDPAHISMLSTVLDGYAQSIIGSDFADTLVATVNDDTIQGGGGNDMIDGGEGDDFAVFSGRRADYTIVENGDGSFTVADKRSTGSEGTDAVSNVENFQFSDTAITSDNLLAQQGAITIDASGADGMDFEAFIRGGFVSGAPAGSRFAFDNSAAFEGEEMFLGFGGMAASKYVLAHGEFAYSFMPHHIVGGTINTIEYGVRGSGAFDNNGYFVGGSAQLRITGLELFNALPADAEDFAGAAAIRANGPVNGFASTNSPAALGIYADALDKYAQKFIGSSKTDFYAGTIFADTISGGNGDDVFGATEGNDAIDGGNDYDQVIFSGASGDYTITRLLDGSYTIANAEGTTTLKGVETATFSDATLDTASGVLLSGTPPKDLSLSVNSVLEDASVGATVGTFSATDAEGNALGFSLVSDASGLFEVSGTALKVKGKLDYETDKTHKIRLKVTDSDGHIVFKDFSIDVGNVNEGPESISISKSVISETSEVGTRVGMLSAVDPEGGAVTYSLTGNPGGYFALTTDGKLTLAKEVDYEKKQSHTITIQATDSTGKSTTQAIKIDVGDVTESKAGTDRNDTLTGSIGRDKLSGGAGVDKLLGNGGNDYLYGGSGNDKLTGGAGADDLWGDSGADTFIFKSIKETTVLGAGRDTIFDFSTKQKDRIDLSAIDANTTKGGNQAFSFIGTKAFGGKAGELRYEKAKSDTYIHGDVNGDKVADFTIHLDDRVSLSKSYFIL